MDIYLQTERLILRTITPADREALLELDSDPEVMRHITGGVTSSPGYIEMVLNRVAGLRAKHKDRFGVYAAIKKSDGAFIGFFIFRPAFQDADNERRIELGYRLRREAWGEGYGTEGSRALVAKAFEELGVEEVFATADQENVASWKIMERLGMALKRSYPEALSPGRPEVTIVEYAIDATSYLAALKDRRGEAAPSRKPDRT